MKYKSVSTIAAILCGTVLSFVAMLAAFAQSDGPEVILTLEGTYKGQVKFVFTGDTIRYEPRTFAPIYPAPTGVTVDGKPWTDLDQPFRLGFRECHHQRESGREQSHSGVGPGSGRAHAQ